ncbi:transporter [uncultured Paraglaciecola sp.]|uniref:transporter n=1 Tax=uncultured Paraglaciecola sp. TaxID=1765024 RepID=UPI00261152F5|nr:transporter [uncultured Paraglaciecola sp.]
MFKQSTLMVGLTAAGLFSLAANAEHSHTTTQAITHAPIGVMGDHLHKKDEFMMSYRFMTMHMSGNLQGSHNISNDDIVTSIANPNAPPATVRVVPQDMSSSMHMLGFMYAPSDDVTLMAMLNYIDRDMSLTTYQGMMGTTVLGDFESASSGLADSKLAVLYRLFDSPNHKVHANLGWVIPTGSIEETGEVLTPMNMPMTLRLPYGMQTGTGSHQGEFGLTYNGYAGNYSWGVQGLLSTSLGENDEAYEPGNKTQLTGWTAYAFSDAVSASVRVKYSSSQEISGVDAKIVAPVTTANPNNYGADVLDLGLGINTVIANKHRIALEYSQPINYKVNGVQMDMDNMLTLGYQIAF